MNKVRMGLTALLLMIITGCTHLDKYLDIREEKGVSSSYRQMLNQWTRRGSIYSQFETKATFITTYKSRTFMKGYLTEYARIYNVTDAEKTKKEDIQQGFSGQFIEFLLYVATPEKEANDFDKANSLWKVSLHDEKGTRHAPVEIRKIEKTSPIMEAFFPFINKYYGTCYTVKFLPVMANEEIAMAANKPIKIMYTSVIGSVEHTWP